MMVSSTIRSVKIQDMKTVILECKKCGATVGYKPCDWKSIPYSCINCGEARMSDGSTDHTVLNGFRLALQRLCEYNEKQPYQVKFEFNGTSE